MKNWVLFDNVRLGPYTLRNRIVLPPLTRSRSSQPGNIPNDLMADYYRQRTGAGLMVTEGTQIEPRGQGYAWTPGIHSPEQVEGWRRVTDAVHAEGGIIFLQLWHVGRVSHTSLQPGGAAPVAPSAIPADNVKVFIETGPGQGALALPSPPRGDAGCRGCRWQGPDGRAICPAVRHDRGGSRLSGSRRGGSPQDLYRGREGA